MHTSDKTDSAKSEGKPMKIDLPAVLRSKLGAKARLVPGFVVRGLEKVICVEALNRLLADNHPKRGAEFCRGVFNDLNVEIDVVGKDYLPDPSQRRVIIVSNHPLGGLDGMALIAFFEEYYGCPVHFVVNDILMAVKPLEDVFVPINKHGAQSREAKKNLDRIFEGDGPVIIFPAGLVSRLQQKDTIKDLEWKKMFVNKAISTQRDIIPVHFSGNNSRFFYKFAKLRKKIGIRFNIEMILLPREVVRSAHKRFTITCGKPIAWQQLKEGKSHSRTAARIKELVYGLPGHHALLKSVSPEQQHS